MELLATVSGSSSELERVLRRLFSEIFGLQGEIFLKGFVPSVVGRSGSVLTLKARSMEPSTDSISYEPDYGSTCHEQALALFGQAFESGSVFSSLLRSAVQCSAEARKPALSRIAELLLGEGCSEGYECEFSDAPPGSGVYRHIDAVFEPYDEEGPSLGFTVGIPASMAGQFPLSLSKNFFLKKRVLLQVVKRATEEKFVLVGPGRKLFQAFFDYRVRIESGDHSMSDTTPKALPLEFVSCTLEMSLEEALTLTEGSVISLTGASEVQGELRVGGAAIARAGLRSDETGLVLVVEQLLDANDSPSISLAVNTECPTAINE